MEIYYSQVKYFTTDILNTTTSYYVTSSEEISSANVGPPQHEGQSNYSSG